MSQQSGNRVWHNWSGAVSCEPHRYYEPTTETELREIVAHHAGERTIRVAGAGHSFSRVVPTNDVLLSLASYTGVTAVDSERQRATVKAGTRLHELNEVLATHGLALANMGDVDRQTIAGALATGTQAPASISAYSPHKRSKSGSSPPMEKSERSHPRMRRRSGPHRCLWARSAS